MKLRSVRVENKKGLKIILVIISIILIIINVIAVTFIFLNNKDNKRIEEIKSEAKSKLVLENKEIEYGTEIKVSDLNLPEDTKLYVSDEEITSTYKFMEVGEIKLIEAKQIDYTNFLGEVQTINVSKDIVYTVVDTQKPVIEGISDKEITVGDEINLKEGIKATDPVDGELEVVLDGTADTNTVGEYKITVKATDKNNNVETKEFTVKVIEKPVVETRVATSNNGTTNKTNSNKGTNASGSNNNANNTTSSTGSNTGTSSSATSGSSASTTTKKYLGPTGKLDQDKPYWCKDGGSEHYHRLGQYEHGWYSSWEQAMEACRQYGLSLNSSGHYKVDQCNGCNKYYYYCKAD